MLVSAAQVSYPASEQVIWCTTHNQTDASEQRHREDDLGYLQI
jgi:hypothetical protein